MTATRQPIDLHEVAPEDRSLIVARDLHFKLALLAAHVADDATECPESVSARVFAAEESAALWVAELDPDWSKARQIAEDALIDALDDSPRGRSADWEWFS